MKTIDVEFDEYPDDVYGLTVAPIPLSAFERISILYDDAARTLISGEGIPAAFHALVAGFLPVARPTLNGKATKLADLDINLTLAIVREWHGGVRNVPLPLPRASSASGPPPEL